MKKKLTDNVKVMCITVILVILIQMIESLPWWSFVIPVLFFGMFINSFCRWKVSGFFVGFLAGFLVWFGANLYFDIESNGIILNRIANLLSVNKVVVYLISGVIGGMLTGLALFIGKNIIVYDKIFNLKQ